MITTREETYTTNHTITIYIASEWIEDVKHLTSS